MVKLNLNLLPPSKKTSLARLVHFLLAKDVLELTLATCAILAIALVWSWFFFQNNFADLASSTTLVNRESYAYQQDVRVINKLIQDVNSASKEYRATMLTLMELIYITPKDIKINSLQLDRRNNTFSLAGSALTRTALLKYQDLLKTIPWIEEIETPVSQLLQKENINFEFKTKLKKILLPHE